MLGRTVLVHNVVQVDTTTGITHFGFVLHIMSVLIRMAKDSLWKKVSSSSSNFWAFWKCKAKKAKIWFKHATTKKKRGAHKWRQCEIYSLRTWSLDKILSSSLRRIKSVCDYYESKVETLWSTDTRAFVGGKINYCVFALYRMKNAGSILPILG